jgi:putative flippase GtrA
MRRWLAFNGVGVIGFVVQLGVLTLGLNVLGWHYLAATAAAVEAAVLHNFVWHQHWTWRDRRGPGARDLMGRLWRFHLLNGFVSLAGNMGITAALTGGLGVHPVAANIVAVLVCSVVNFFGSEVLVFRTAPAAIVFLLVPTGLGAAGSTDELTAELQPQTVAAWQQYERVVNERHRTATEQAQPYFAHDAYRRDANWRSRVLKGGIEMFQAEVPRPGAGNLDVPDGKIHHWVGAMFVPGATVQSVLDRVRQNAGRESDGYKDVVASRLIERNGDTARVFMRIRRDASVVTVNYNTEHQVHYRMLGTTRAAVLSIATRIAEIARAGTSREQEKPPGDDSGYLWRLNAYWRYEQVPGGVLIECESVSLSRSVPYVVRFLVNRVADSLARESLASTMSSLRDQLAAAR